MKTIFKNTFNNNKFLTYSLGIREKIAAMWIVIVIIMGVWFGWQSESITRQVMVNNLKNHGISMARDVAAHSAESIVTHNLHHLSQILTNALENNTNLVYIYILDSEGELILKTHSPEYSPIEMAAIPALSTNDCFVTTIHQMNNSRIHDIVVPICNNIGLVRLGIAENSIEEELIQTRTTLISTILVIISVGSLITIFYTKKLLSPLQELTAATQSLIKGDFSPRVPMRSQDEIGQLTASFNLLAEKLGSYKIINTKNQAELDRKEKLRIELVKHLITAQEEERKRIARELHDETSQSLTALKLGLKTIEESTSLKKIKEISNELRQMLGATLGEITAISRNLRPSILDDMGLNAALVRFIEETSKRIGQNIIYKSKGLNNHRFPFYIETAVYRIVQEAVTNSIKYAKAENIFVSINYENKTLKGIIHDNGAGFKPALVLDGSIPQRGLGLFGMQERAALIGGKLEIDSDIGQGTTITVIVPNVNHIKAAGN